MASRGYTGFRWIHPCVEFRDAEGKGQRTRQIIAWSRKRYCLLGEKKQMAKPLLMQKNEHDGKA